MKKIYITIIILLKNIISWTPYYDPFNNLKDPRTNTIYGTGNRLIDTSYRAYSAIKCKQEEYNDDNCCVGSSYANLKCLNKKECLKIQNFFRNYVLKIAFLSYFSFILLTMIIVFILYYCNSEQTHKIRNGTAASIIVFCGALIIPIILIQIYCCYKNIEIYQFFGGDFKKCCYGKNILNLQSVDIKENNQREIQMTNKSGNRFRAYREVNEKNNISNK